MPNVDLSEYAGLLIISIIGICAFSIYLNKKVVDTGAYILPIIITVIGMAICGLIGSSADFDDGSPEVYITTIVCTVLPHIVYELFLLSAIIKEKRLNKINSRITEEQQRLNELHSLSKSRKDILKLLDLVELCGGNLASVRNHDRVSSDLDLLNKEKHIKANIDKLQMRYSSIKNGGTQ